MLETIIQFVPITVIYVVASLIAISRRGGEQTRSKGFRRWRRMHLWIVGAFVTAFILAYIEWSMPYPTPDLMTLTGHWLFRCLIAACIIAALVGYLKRRAARRLLAFEWRLYLMRKGVGLEYAVHNKDGWALLGYLHAKFCDSGERISDDWKLFLSYYSGRQEEHFQLMEAMFTDADQFAGLITKCRILDRSFDSDATGWKPTFVHVPTRKRLPLGGPADTDLENISKYIERQLDAGTDDEISFSKISNEVFVR